MQFFVISIENEVFSNGDYPEKYNHPRGFRTQSNALNFIKEKVIPDMTQEKIDYYVDEEITTRILYEDEDTVNVGVFSDNEIIERITFEISLICVGAE